MESEWLVPAGALIVSVATLVLTSLSLNYKASTARVSSIDERMRDQNHRIESLITRVEACEHDRYELRERSLVLQAENVDLQRVVAANALTITTHEALIEQLQHMIDHLKA